MKKIYTLTLAELKALSTISQGQFDDLKIETATRRVWLSRCTVEDGEPYNNKVTVERLEKFDKDRKRGGWHKSPHWVIDYTYEAK